MIRESVKHHAWLIGMGDYQEMLSGSERAMMRRQLHESTDQIIEDLVIKNTLELANVLRPASDHILGMVQGNHYMELLDGRTSTQLLCEKIGAPYLGEMGLVKVNLETNDHGRACIVLCVHHGTSSGAANSLLAVKKLEQVARADIYVMGHSHGLAAEREARLIITKSHKGRLTVKEAPIVFGRSGSFLRQYMDRERSYAVKRAYRPAALGVLDVDITLRRPESRDSDHRRTRLTTVEMRAAI